VVDVRVLDGHDLLSPGSLMSESKWEIGDNLKAVILAVVGVALAALQIWNVNETMNARAAADEARDLSGANAVRIKKVQADVRDSRNDHRRMVGQPPVGPVEE
jgi:hypothetical protein